MASEGDRKVSKTATPHTTTASPPVSIVAPPLPSTVAELPVSSIAGQVSKTATPHTTTASPSVSSATATQASTVAALPDSSIAAQVSKTATPHTTTASTSVSIVAAPQASTVAALSVSSIAGQEVMSKVEVPKLLGSTWDEAGKTEIMQILISHEKNSINSLQFIYKHGEDVHHSGIHGQPNGLKFNVVSLDYPQEFLTSVSGVYGCHSGLLAITFGTNKRRYGPFGKKSLGNGPEFKNVKRFRGYKKFNYEFGHKSCFGGFHGSIHNSRVYALGIYIKLIEKFAELKDSGSVSTVQVHTFQITAEKPRELSGVVIGLDKKKIDKGKAIAEPSGV